MVVPGTKAGILVASLAIEEEALRVGLKLCYYLIRSFGPERLAPEAVLEVLEVPIAMVLLSMKCAPDRVRSF